MCTTHIKKHRLATSCSPERTLFLSPFLSSLKIYFPCWIKGYNIPISIFLITALFRKVCTYLEIEKIMHGWISGERWIFIFPYLEMIKHDINLLSPVEYSTFKNTWIMSHTNHWACWPRQEKQLPLTGHDFQCHS